MGPEIAYEKLAQVGEGTYGYGCHHHFIAARCLMRSRRKVYKARCLTSGRLVALKRIRLEMEKEGFPLTSMREIRLLQRVNHPNVLCLLDVVYAKGYAYMVSDYLEYDLNGILAHPAHSYEPDHVKCLMRQLLSGLSYLHSRGILHRDIKGSNILVDREGHLRLADFGLARLYSHKLEDCTNRVITMWYRPPELLLGATDYGSEVDMWGIGCLFIEMFIRKPLFAGNDEISQLNAIYRICGTPTVETWPDLPSLPWYNLVRSRRAYPNILKEAFQGLLSRAGLEMATGMLSLNPAFRLSALQCLDHAYFSESPIECTPEELPMPEGEWHEFESKMRKKQRQASNAGATGSSSAATPTSGGRSVRDL
eukprot:Partr_v1_DN25619_c0_g1_i1_m4894 putative Cyclin-Dependent Kinase